MDEIRALDSVDLQILNILQTVDGISNAELAKRINLSPPAVHKED